MDIEKLIKGSEGLIKKIASQFYNSEFEDLYQAGVLGLLKAYKNYKENGTTKFSTYAYDYIYGEMYQFVQNKNIKINKDITKLYKVIEKTITTLTQKYNRVPSLYEVSKFLNINEKLIYDAYMSGKEIMSIDNEDNNVLNSIKANNTNIDNKILIDECLDNLSKDEKNIIKARFYEDLTQSETAKKLCMTQVMVSRYEKRSLSKMQQFMMQ